MLGEVSASYDPEFGTNVNAEDVRDLLLKVRKSITKLLGSELKNIVQVAQGKAGEKYTLVYTERDLRGIRFALDRALETI